MHWVAPRWGGQLSAQSFNYAWRARMHNTGVQQVCLLHLDLHSLIGLRLAALGRGLTDKQEKLGNLISDKAQIIVDQLTIRHLSILFFGICGGLLHGLPAFSSRMPNIF